MGLLLRIFLLNDSSSLETLRISHCPHTLTFFSFCSCSIYSEPFNSLTLNYKWLLKLRVFLFARSFAILRWRMQSRLGLVQVQRYTRECGGVHKHYLPVTFSLLVEHNIKINIWEESIVCPQGRFPKLHPGFSGSWSFPHSSSLCEILCSTKIYRLRIKQVNVLKWI